MCNFCSLLIVYFSTYLALAVPTNITVRQRPVPQYPGTLVIFKSSLYYSHPVHFLYILVAKRTILRLYITNLLFAKKPGYWGTFVYSPLGKGLFGTKNLKNFLGTK